MENKNKNIKADSSQLNSSGLDLLCLNESIKKKQLAKAQNQIVKK
jgi:hypothetical protein